ncbi:MAG: 30S ribosomal protein S20 [PS1 clade bacterium]|nr:30S ribosomal protein S20 [PS1 clade bacterium]CAI8413961.1 MAG: 30S ribosomal protein S20 [Rhodobiaceae bacterium UBA7378]HCQ81569.1 30S ribosomal protein S20 [Rhodobiaceae bacterium]|tara:strand:- start:1130 stop:1393 length:264 start_codon:yes stop_codon:yes gene_type:complete
MANTSSAKKMVRKIAARTVRNRHQRSQMRSSIRRVEEAIESGSKDDAISALRVAQPMIAKAGHKGLVHKRAAARKVSRLAKRVASIS